MLPPCAAGDLLAFMSAGAYGAAMSQPTIRACWCPRCWSKGADWAVVRPRPTYADLIGLDRVPDWLA